jgi:hypothetical protein
MLSLDDALAFVRKHTALATKYRDYAVSDFLNYMDWVKPPEGISDAEYQKTWALYLKWKQLCNANYADWYSANGTPFVKNPETRKFRYTPGGVAATAPTIHKATDPRSAAMIEATLAGVGQCEYFATQAYQALKIRGKAGTTPRVDKVSTPGHNWVLVNYSPRDGNERGRESPNWVAVDYWLLALGVPPGECICRYDQGFIRFPPPFRFVETFNPYNEE